MNIIFVLFLFFREREKEKKKKGLNIQEQELVSQLGGLGGGLQRESERARELEMIIMNKKYVRAFVTRE